MKRTTFSKKSQIRRRIKDPQNLNLQSMLTTKSLLPYSNKISMMKTKPRNIWEVTLEEIKDQEVKEEVLEEVVLVEAEVERDREPNDHC